MYLHKIATLQFTSLAQLEIFEEIRTSKTQQAIWQNGL